MIAIPPLAAGIDWLETLLPVLFVGFWILSQIVAIGKKLAGPAAPREIARPAAPPVAPELHEEIREFLERAASRTQTTKTAPAPPAKERPRAKPARPRSPLVPPGSATISEKVREDLGRELRHLETPLTREPAAEAASKGHAKAGGGHGQAAELVAMLRSPESVRRAILLREILDRPVDRW